MSSTFCAIFGPGSRQCADVYRRLIGRRFEDETVTKDIRSWPFKVIDQGGSPMIEVEYLGEKKKFSAQEISAMVLVKVCAMFRAQILRAHANTHADEGGR
jgi:molecular chaperone DnaK (HSP70)